MAALEMDRSRARGPTKTLKVCDWPGPLEKMPRPATPRIVQP
jgi:hypothetical protein